MSEPHSGRPFLLRYAELVRQPKGVPFRYNTSRQIGEVCIAGVWIDAIDAPSTAMTSDTTKITEIRKETTDDQ